MSDQEQAGQGSSQGDDDVSLFGMENTAGQSELAIKVTKSNSRKMFVVVGLVLVLSFMLLFCIGAGVIGLIVLSRRPQQEEIAKKKELAPPVEMKAKIKNIDRSQRTLRLLVGDGKYQTFHVTPTMEFRDENGLRLNEGLDAKQLQEDLFVTILTTDDRQGLQWLKLAR